MLYAVGNSNNRIRARPNDVGRCPACEGEMIPKCGEINVWHWAHKTLRGCDPWFGKETEWHLCWKARFPNDWVEQLICAASEERIEKHIADVRLPTSGLVIEFQHSPISPSEIGARENFYGKMIWVFDIRKSAERKCVDVIDGYQFYESRFDIRHRDNHCTFRWKHPKKHIAYTTCPTFLDIGRDRLFWLKKFYSDSPAGGWGHLISKKDFVTRILSQHNPFSNTR